MKKGIATRLRSKKANASLCREATDEIDRLRSAIACLAGKGAKSSKGMSQRWIPVSKRLPDECDYVLVYHSFHEIVMAWYDGFSWCTHGVWCGRGKVTHWIPLPAPPPEEEDDD